MALYSKACLTECKSKSEMQSVGFGTNPRVYARGLGVDSELEPEPLP